MNKTQRNNVVSSDEWYTPKWVVDELGPFDLDPCAPMSPPYTIAPLSYNKQQDGLSSIWPDGAFVFMNPPYSRTLLRPFVEKLAEHDNGIALLKNQVDNTLFQEVIFPKAKSLLFMRHRIKFLQPDGTTGSPFFGSVLVAFGHEADTRLRQSSIQGKYIILN